MPENLVKGILSSSLLFLFTSNHHVLITSFFRIKGLLYTIAEEQAKRTAYIHRGTRCDSCGEFPIKGVRWHCINCPDYDLCSACESQSPSVHPRTHVFAKIKIPISTLAQPHQVHDLWYPGDPLRHWPPLKIILRKKLVSETGFEDVAMEALYEQFTCIANVAYPNDTTDIKAAIDRRAFNKAMSSDKWPAPLEPNFLFDRMFAFYDTDNNSLIGFEEFVHGLAYLRQPQASTYPFKKKDMKRLIKGYDVDGDGLVSRSDFVRMLSAKYAVQRHIIRDVVAAEEAEIVAHTSSVFRSSQPISAAFTGEDVPYGEQRTPALKTLDAFGDMQMAEGDTNVTLPDGGEIWDEETVNTVARRYGRTSDVVGQGQAFSMGHAQDVRSRYGRVEQVPVPQEGQHLSDDMVLVETDPRRNRGSADLEPAEVRWRTDLNDAISGGAGIPGFNLQDRQDEARDDGTDTTGVRANGRQEPSIPDSILDRNRAFPIPQSELPNTHSILYQVIQESINELLDPLFAESESLAYHVRSTREERQIWRENIDEYVTELAKLREEEQRLREVLRTGGAMDPLLGVADGVIRGQQQQARRRIPVRGRIVRAEDVESEQPNGSWSRQADSDNEHSEQRRSAAPSPAIGPNDASVNWTRRVNDIATARRAQVEEEAPSPESSDDDEMPSLMEQDSQFESRESPERRPSQSENFAAQLRQQIEAGTDMLPTDDEGLEDLEFNIRQQPLDELLAESGYSLTASASDSSLTNSILQSPRDETGAEQIYPRSSAASGTTVADIEHHGTSNNTEQEQASNENGLVDLTLPQHRPNTDAFLSLGATPSGLDHLTQIRNADEQESTLLSLPSLAIPTSSTPFQMTDLPSSFQQITASVNELVHDIPSTIPARSSSPQNTNVDDKDGAPSRERLHYLHRLDEEERKILERGGPGRLDYDEVEEICSSEASGALIGLVCGWVEWAGF